jgi:hypothetical protein
MLYRLTSGQDSRSLMRYPVVPSVLSSQTCGAIEVFRPWYCSLSRAVPNKSGRIRVKLGGLVQYSTYSGSVCDRPSERE